MVSEWRTGSACQMCCGRALLFCARCGGTLSHAGREQGQFSLARPLFEHACLIPRLWTGFSRRVCQAEAACRRLPCAASEVTLVEQLKAIEKGESCVVACQLLPWFVCV